MGTSERAEHEIIIEPARGWFQMEWRELWEYRDLIYLLTRRDFVSRYKQTLLGPAWFILQPLFTTAVFAVIFGRVAGIPTDGIPGPLFYLCGLLAWGYFSQTVTTGANLFANNTHLFTKVYFPRIIVPLAIVVSNLASFFIQLVPFALFYLWYRFHGNATELSLQWHAIAFPLLILQTMLLGLGVTLWLAAATAKYRDLVHLNQFLIQVWMFATPIIYPLSKAHGAYGWILLLNPMTAIVEGFRIVFLNRGTLTGESLALSVGLTLAILVTGLLVFQKVEKNVADSV